MNAIEEALKELLDDLLPPLQAAESRSTAILQLLKDKGIVSDDELAPYLEQAANASSVKERAARLRFEHLFASVIKGVRELVQESATKVLQERSGQSKQSEASIEGSNESRKKEQHSRHSENQSGQTPSSADSAGDERKQEKPAPDATVRDNAA